MGLSPRIETIEADVATNSASTDSLGSKTASMDQADAPLISVPYTDIIGRAPIRDLSKIPSPKMGIERILTTDVIELTGETTGEGLIYKTDDQLDRVRYGGNWILKRNTSHADYMRSADDTAFMEITFYGTGLNVLDLMFSPSGFPDYNVYVNNVLETTVVNDNTQSSVIGERNYATNRPRSLVSGKPLDTYTVRIEMIVSGGESASAGFYGFEILNESTTIDVPVNSAVLVGEDRHLIPAGANLGYALASDFDSASDDPTTDGKGGAVVVYSEKQADGSIEVKQRFSAVDSAQLNLALADHSNEEVIAKYNWREFGAGRGDDFSTLSIVEDNRTFTLDDGTTTLTGDQVYLYVGHELALHSDTSRITLTFVGTGLGVGVRGSGSGNNDVEVFIDGTSVGNVLHASSTSSTEEIVSGLPYGTHTIKLIRNAAAVSQLSITDFIIYGPKKPSIPEGAGRLGSYYLMADFVADTTAGDITIPTGVLRKNRDRELTYSGTWVFSGMGFADTFGIAVIRTSIVASYVEYTFFGTGFDFRHDHATAGLNTFNVSIDGITNFDTAGYTASVSSGDGSYSINSSTGVLSGAASATPLFHSDHLVITGIPLGLHTVKIEHAAGILDVAAFDIITPIHSYDSSAELLHDRLIGSNGIKSETGLADFTKNKQHFPDGVDLGKSKVKWQKKILTAGHTTTGVISELTLNNLTIGKTYKCSWNAFIQVDSGDDWKVSAEYTDGTTIAVVTRIIQATGVTIWGKESSTFTFTAAHTSIQFNAEASTGTPEIQGGTGGAEQTWVTLEELPNHIETDEW